MTKENNGIIQFEDGSSKDWEEDVGNRGNKWGLASLGVGVCACEACKEALFSLIVFSASTFKLGFGMRGVGVPRESAVKLKLLDGDRLMSGFLGL